MRDKKKDKRKLNSVIHNRVVYNGVVHKSENTIQYNTIQVKYNTSKMQVKCVRRRKLFIEN